MSLDFPREWNILLPPWKFHLRSTVYFYLGFFFLFLTSVLLVWVLYQGMRHWASVDLVQLLVIYLLLLFQEILKFILPTASFIFTTNTSYPASIQTKSKEKNFHLRLYSGTKLLFFSLWSLEVKLFYCEFPLRSGFRHCREYSATSQLITSYSK